MAIVLVTADRKIVSSWRKTPDDLRGPSPVRVGVAHRLLEMAICMGVRTHRAKGRYYSSRAQTIPLFLHSRATRMCTIVPRSKAGWMAARLHDRHGDI